jgi:hypothetical protein
MNAILADPNFQMLLTAVGGYLLAALKLRFPSLPIPTPAPAPAPGPVPAPVPTPGPVPGPAPVPGPVPAEGVKVASFSDAALEQLKPLLVK